jgi:hypothetical protein
MTISADDADTLQDSPAMRGRRSGSVRRVLRENGLSILLISLFLLLLGVETLVGYHAYNNQRAQHHQPTVSYLLFLTTGRCLEATAENWESEFLEMAAFVWLTSIVYQKGSPQSKDPCARDVNTPLTARSPLPARRGGWALAIYRRSLSIAFVILFLIAFTLHAVGGRIDYNEDQARHGQPPASLLSFLTSSEFWFQSLQNWQSEFLGIASMVILSIWLRQQGSAESKHVNTPHEQNED